MTEQTDSYDSRAREAVARALMDDSEVETVSAAATTTGRVDPKALFCEHWETVKQVLQFVKDYLPKYLRPIVSLIIKAGDALKATIC
ncbi:MAG TPA: hypothetical protein VF759_14895 [Allosphingosinicella sp.]|jgi:hypothetical protein